MPKCTITPRPVLENVKFDKDDGREGLCSTFYHYIIGKLIYFINIQLNLTYVIGICKLSYMRMPKRSHLEAYIAHHYFRYMKNTKKLYEIFYNFNDENKIYGFTNVFGQEIMVGGDLPLATY